MDSTGYNGIHPLGPYQLSGSGSAQSFGPYPPFGAFAPGGTSYFDQIRHDQTLLPVTHTFMAPNIYNLPVWPSTGSQYECGGLPFAQRQQHSLYLGRNNGMVYGYRRNLACCETTPANGPANQIPGLFQNRSERFQPYHPSPQHTFRTIPSPAMIPQNGHFDPEPQGSVGCLSVWTPNSHPPNLQHSPGPLLQQQPSIVHHSSSHLNPVQMTTISSSAIEQLGLPLHSYRTLGISISRPPRDNEPEDSIPPTLLSPAWAYPFSPTSTISLSSGSSDSKSPGYSDSIGPPSSENSSCCSPEIVDLTTDGEEEKESRGSDIENLDPEPDQVSLQGVDHTYSYRGVLRTQRNYLGVLPLVTQSGIPASDIEASEGSEDPESDSAINPFLCREAWNSTSPESDLQLIAGGSMDIDEEPFLINEIEIDSNNDSERLFICEAPIGSNEQTGRVEVVDITGEEPPNQKSQLAPPSNKESQLSPEGLIFRDNEGQSVFISSDGQALPIIEFAAAEVGISGEDDPVLDLSKNTGTIPEFPRLDLRPEQRKNKADAFLCSESEIITHQEGAIRDTVTLETNESLEIGSSPGVAIRNEINVDAMEDGNAVTVYVDFPVLFKNTSGSQLKVSVLSPSELTFEQNFLMTPVVRISCNGVKGYLHKTKFIDGDEGQCITTCPTTPEIWLTPRQFEVVCGLTPTARFSWKYTIIAYGFPLFHAIALNLLPNDSPDLHLPEDWSPLLDKYIGDAKMFKQRTSSPPTSGVEIPRPSNNEEPVEVSDPERKDNSEVLDLSRV